MHYSEAAIFFKAMSDETRLKIMDMLSCDELCACELLEKFDITQPTLSYHMKILTDSKLVSSRKDGPMTRYTLNMEIINTVTSFFVHITTEEDSCICKE